MVSALNSRKGDFVVFADLSEGAKKRIAMTGNDYIPRATRERGGRDVARRPPQGVIATAFQYHDGYTDPGYFHPSNQGALGKRWRGGRGAQSSRGGRRGMRPDAADLHLRFFPGGREHRVKQFPKLRNR